PASPFEAVLQLFLRNVYAAELFRLGNAPVVLATGLVDAGTPVTLRLDLIRAASKGQSVGEVLGMIRRSVSQGQTPALGDLLFPIGTAPVRTEYTSRTMYALLVGIDDYPSPIPKLRGCANDIDAFGSYLSERVAKDKGVAIKLKTLKNGKATRQAVVDAFSDHLGKAKKGDVALFYYSGHGSQEQAPEEFWKLEPDHLDETLVLFDSRNKGSWDLADKEIAKLIGDVAAKGPHVAVILDCCHSGSGTREIQTVVRHAPTNLRRRPIESFLVSVDEAKAASA